MRANLRIHPRTGKTGLCLGLAVMFCASMNLRAQQADSAPSGINEGWQQLDWLKPAATETTFSATSGQDLKDPATVLLSGGLWQEKYDATCTRKIDDTLLFSYQTSAIKLDDGPSPYLTPAVAPGEGVLNAGTPAPGVFADDGLGYDFYRKQTAGLQFQPFEALTVRGNFHDSTGDLPNPAAPTLTAGTGFSAEGRLPMNSTLTFDLNSDRSGTDLLSGAATHDTTCNAQLQEPLGKMPLTAVLKGHYEEITEDGSPASRFPSLEQSLVWKPAPETTLRMGLRQQQYQENPVISNEFNQALFGDWSQTLLPNVSWHSYAEMLNSKGLETISPTAASSTSPSGANPSLSSALPVSFDNETLTFTTGPAFKLQDDLSASIEYSSRWDKNPLPGSQAGEQRLSVSLKGSF